MATPLAMQPFWVLTMEEGNDKHTFDVLTSSSELLYFYPCSLKWMDKKENIKEKMRKKSFIILVINFLHLLFYPSKIFNLLVALWSIQENKKRKEKLGRPVAFVNSDWL